MLIARDGILQQLADRPGDPKLIRDLGKLYLMNGSNESTLKLAVRYLEQSIQIGASSAIWTARPLLIIGACRQPRCAGVALPRTRLELASHQSPVRLGWRPRSTCFKRVDRLPQGDLYRLPAEACRRKSVSTRICRVSRGAESLQRGCGHPARGDRRRQRRC